MLFCILGIGRIIFGAVKERYLFIPCLIYWRLFRGVHVVLWLGSLGWRRLIATFVFRVESLVVFFIFSWFVTFSVGCCRTTSGIGGSLNISFVSNLSRAAPEWRRGVFSLKLGLRLGHCCLSCFELFFVDLGSVLPVVYFVEAVCLLHLLQGSISLWSGYFHHMSHRVESRSRFSVSLIIYIVSFGIVCNFVVVGVRVCLGASIVVVGTICVKSCLAFLLFELTTLILIVTWFFTMVGRWSGLVSFAVGLVASQCLWAFRLELPNRSILTPFQVA